MSHRRYTGRGAALKAARLVNGQTQRWVAAASRVHERTVIRAEKGGDVSPENLLSICAALGVDRLSLPSEDPAAPPGPGVEATSPAAQSRRAVRLTMHAAAAACMVLATAGTYYVAGAVRIDRKARLGQDIVRSIDALRAGDAVATLAGSLSAGAAGKGALDVVAAGFRMNYERCDLATWVDFALMRGCPLDSARLRIVETSPSALTVAFGPLTKPRAAAILTRLPPEPGIGFRLAPSPGPDADPATLTWTDPFGRRAGDLTDFDDGSWLYVDLRRTGGDT